MGKVEYSGRFKRLKAVLKSELKVELRAELRAEILELRVALHDGCNGDLPDWVHVNDVRIHQDRSESRADFVQSIVAPQSPILFGQSSKLESSKGFDMEYHDVEMVQERSLGNSEDEFQKGPVIGHADRGGAQEEMEDEETAKYQEISLDSSLWDAAIFIGSPHVGAVGSMVLGVLLLLNFFIQIIMIMILHMAGLTSPSIGAAEVEQLRNWRVIIAHDYKYFNVLSQQTLAARVCAEDFGLEVGASQLQAYSELRAYLGDNDGYDWKAVGPGMCIVAMIVWSLTIVREASTVVNVLNGICSVKWTRKSELRMDTEGALTIDTLSWIRGLWMVAVQLSRLVICFMLAWFGCLFLAYTPAVPDLLLNTVALEFIISTDELLFASLAPSLTKYLIDSTLPFRVRQGRRWHGLDLRTGITLLAVVAFVFTFAFSVILPQVSLLVSARDALCSGDVDFVYTNDGLGVAAWAYPDGVDEGELNPRNYPDGLPVSLTRGSVEVPRRSFSEGLLDVMLRQQGREQIQVDCTLEMCQETDPVTGWVVNVPGARRPDCCFVQKLRVPETNGGRFSIKAKAVESIAAATQIWNPTCQDVLDSGFQYDVLLRGGLGDAVNAVDPEACPESHKCPSETPMCFNHTCVAPTCQLVAKYCQSDTIAGVRARQLCPQTCKCDHPGEGPALTLPDSGCGYMCLRSGAYLARRRALPCEDDDAALKVFLDDWDKVRLGWPIDWDNGSGHIIEAMRIYGCAFLGNNTVMQEAQEEAQVGFVPYILGNNLCSEGGGFFPITPLSYYCPVACGCRSGHDHCPDSCPPQEPFSEGVLNMCPAHQRGMWAYFGPDTPEEDQRDLCPIKLAVAA